MVLPIVVGQPSVMHHDHLSSVAAAGVAGMNSLALIAALIHTLGYLAITVVLAVVIYEKVGLRVLRRAWINVNVIWSGALIAAAVASVLG